MFDLTNKILEERKKKTKIVSKILVNCFILQLLKDDYFHHTVVLADIQRKKEKDWAVIFLVSNCHFSYDLS